MEAAPALEADRLMPMKAASRRRYYERYHRSNHAPREQTQLRVPEDVRRFEGVPEPCFKCGVRDNVPCKHRPWVVAS